MYQTDGAVDAEAKQLLALRTGLEKVSQAGPMGMGNHGGLDLQCQRQRFAALAQSDTGRLSGADGIEK
jgi:hypothetical protein